MIIQGHCFDTEAEAIEAIAQINTGENIPVSASAITQTYCEAIEYFEGWYIHSDTVTQKYLGVPVPVNLPDIE